MQSVQWRRVSFSFSFGFAVAIALLASGLARADRIQLKIDQGSGPIEGYSTLRGYEKTIDVDSFQWGVGVAIGPRTGGPLVLRPTVSDITWTQRFDPTYNALSQALVTGEDGFKSVFSFLGTGNGRDAPPRYLEIVTDQVAISGLSFSTGGGAPSVSASQALRNFEMKYKPATANKGDSTVKYNSVTQEVDATDSLGSFSAGRTEADGLYLRVGGSGIRGESGVTGYENWIELSSAQMGMGIGLTPKPSGGFAHSTPSISELTVTQTFDRAVPKIMGALLQGSMFDEATLELVQSTARGPVTTMQLVLEDVLFSGLSISSGGDRPQVSESLNFGAFTQTIWAIDRDGLRGQASVFKYDVATNTSSFGGTALPQSVSMPEFGPGMVTPPALATPVPEPHAWALMSGGIAMLVLLGRRRKTFS